MERKHVIWISRVIQPSKNQSKAPLKGVCFIITWPLKVKVVHVQEPCWTSKYRFLPKYNFWKLLKYYFQKITLIYLESIYYSFFPLSDFQSLNLSDEFITEMSCIYFWIGTYFIWHVFSSVQAELTEELFLIILLNDIDKSNKCKIQSNFVTFSQKPIWFFKKLTQ